MSAPPSGANGQRPPAPKPKLTAEQAAAMLRRRKQKALNADPLRPRQKPAPKPVMPAPSAKRDAEELDPIEAAKRGLEQKLGPKLRELEAARKQNNGWSTEAAAQEYPLVTTKRALLEGIRYHIMRLQDKGGKGSQNYNIMNPEQFPRPVTLHRRDPRLPPAHRMVVKEEQIPTDPAYEAEAERIRKQKADREAQRALDQAQIAPVAKGNEPKQKQQNKKEKPSVFYGRNSDEQKKQSGIRYEETLPWHLEDADGKSGVWVGSYVAGLSDVNCALVIDGGNFRMIPLERWYKFDEKPRFDTLTLDDAENMMKQNKDVKRWVMLDREKQASEQEKNETRSFLRGRARIKMESATSRGALRSEKQDDHDIDMSGDEFQDDDETPGFEADDEDAKESKDRVRREQVGANLFGEGEEGKVEEEEREARLEKYRQKVIGKTTRKKLMKLEHAMDYDDLDSDQDNNPFADSSESDSDTEKDKDKEKEKEEEAKKQAELKDGTAPTDTPPGKQKAAAGPVKKLNNKLKRPGSPNLSDSSGNESTRKKVKTGKGTSSQMPSRSGTPLPGRPKPAGGATSDGEATAGEGSDGGMKLKKKIKIKSAGTGSTSVSRAGSPDAMSPGGSANKQGSATPRNSPPPPSTTRAPAQSQGPPKAIEQEEIVAFFEAHPGGSTLGDLLNVFKHRVDKGATTKKEWISMVKRVASLGEDKKLHLNNKFKKAE
ncbi:hypothetical protein V8F33_012638 [Rhypophila sp. PSN 637]